MSKEITYINAEKMRQYIQSPDEVLIETLDIKYFKERLLKYFEIKTDRTLAEKIYEELRSDVSMLSILCNISKFSAKDFITILVTSYPEQNTLANKKLLKRALKSCEN